MILPQNSKLMIDRHPICIFPLVSDTFTHTVSVVFLIFKSIFGRPSWTKERLKIEEKLNLPVKFTFLKNIKNNERFHPYFEEKRSIFIIL